MEAADGEHGRETGKKIMRKQLTGKRDDTPLHSAARARQLSVIIEIIGGKCNSSEGAGLKELLSKQNQAGETALFVAAENGYVEIVTEMIKYYDLVTAGIKARNGFDSLHIAAKQGDLEVVKALMEAYPELSMTVDASNTTALHTAAAKGHTHLVHYLLEMEPSLTAIARSNGKTALHSAARNGHVDIVNALLRTDPAIAGRKDKKGQTALHMAVKGHNIDVVHQLIQTDPNSTLNMFDTKGNTLLHIATRKGRAEIVKLLLSYPCTDTKAVNRVGETAIDTAEKTGQAVVAGILREHGVLSARSIKPQPTNPVRELKKTVSDIKHEVHDQLEHTLQTRKRVHGIAKRLNKMHSEGLNNAINSTTVVAVLIATVAFAAIFTVPGQFVDDPSEIPPGQVLGEANIAPRPAFLVFFVFDSFALFISLAVVVVQTSVVVIESNAKKQMMSVINKLMWVACALTSVAFLALGFIVVGERERWLAITVTIIGSTIMAGTLGTMCYWVIMHRIEASNLRNIRRKSSLKISSRSWSRRMSAVVSDSDVLTSEVNKMYAI